MSFIIFELARLSSRDCFKYSYIFCDFIRAQALRSCVQDLRITLQIITIETIYRTKSEKSDVSDLVRPLIRIMNNLRIDLCHPC